MTKNQKQILTFGGIILLFLLFTKKTAAAGFSSIITAAKNFIHQNEGFSSKPIWDYKQWSWGYGTRVPGSIDDKNKNPGGTITRDQAANEAAKVMAEHYQYLSKLITRPLTANQWAALLSFSYNLGKYNADNLIAMAPVVGNINSGNDQALFSQWIQYINAGGQPLDSLKKRREREIALWRS